MAVEQAFSRAVARASLNVSQKGCVVGQSVIMWVAEGDLPNQGEEPFRPKAGHISEVFVVFVGQHEHSLDGKGRVVLPASFREFVAERGYVTQLDGCIGMWSADGFQAVSGKWKQELDNGVISSSVFRRLIRGVQDVKLDAAGRITLPKELLEKLGFKSKVVVTGRLDRAEIWPMEVFEAEQTDADEAEFNATVRRLGL